MMKNVEIYKKIKSNFDALSKPLDGFGRFEDIISRMGAVIGDEMVDISKAALTIFIADNGIIEEGVSQSDEKVTLSVARMLGKRQTSVCFMAKEGKIDVYPYDLGIKKSENIEGVDKSYYICPSTNNFVKEPALGTINMNKAIDAGKSIVKKLYESGYKVVLLGEMGIGNTTTSTAVIASILGIDAGKICGRGAGLSDEGLSKKTNVINLAIEKYKLYEATPLEVLESVGGLDIAAMVGVIEDAYEYGMAVILDGLITAAAALVATELDAKYKDVIFFSHLGRENGMRPVLDRVKMTAVIDGDMALGEGTGAVMFMQLIKSVMSVYDKNSTFNDSGIAAYERFT